MAGIVPVVGPIMADFSDRPNFLRLEDRSVEPFNK